MLSLFRRRGRQKSDEWMLCIELFAYLHYVHGTISIYACQRESQRGCCPRGAHGAPGHVRLAASMNPDAHARCTSPPHSVPSPGAMLCSMASNPGYLNDAACVVHAVRGRHPQSLG